MSFEDVSAEVSILMTKMQNEPEDRHELFLLLSEKLAELRAFGMPLPDDLVKFEAALAAEFEAEKRER